MRRSASYIDVATENVFGDPHYFLHIFAAVTAISTSCHDAGLLFFPKFLCTQSFISYSPPFAKEDYVFDDQRLNIVTLLHTALFYPTNVLPILQPRQDPLPIIFLQYYAQWALICGRGQNQQF